VAEGLAGVARVVEEKKLIDSLEVGKDKVKVNMLQYADDTMFFCEANSKSVFNIKAILHCFELASGFRVNFLKSKLGGTEMDHVSLQRFVAILNCDTMVSPFVYLGLPVSGSHKRSVFCYGVIKKVQARLSRWKDRCLLMARRICLIRFVLSSIPLFVMSLFKLSSEICKSHEFGGLGIIDPKLFNLALLGKWIWRLGVDKGGLWKEVLVSKYGGWRSLG